MFFVEVPYPREWGAEANTLITDVSNTQTMNDKFKDIEAISMGPSESLVISFHGFTDKDEVKEFADYIFAKIKISYHSLEKPPSIH